jgi:hypothetical protein
MKQDKKTAPVKIKRQTLNLWPDPGKILGLGRNSTYAAAERGDVRVIRIGKRLLVPIAEIERLLNGGAPAKNGLERTRQNRSHA